MTGLREWLELNEYFPALKYQSSPSRFSRHGRKESGRGLEFGDGVEPTRTSAVKTGWIYLGIGACLAWKIYSFHVLFLVAVGLGATAMATRQIRWGLPLILSALAASGLPMKVSDYLVARELEAMCKPLAEKLD